MNLKDKALQAYKEQQETEKALIAEREAKEEFFLRNRIIQILGEIGELEYSHSYLLCFAKSKELPGIVFNTLDNNALFVTAAGMEISHEVKDWADVGKALMEVEEGKFKQLQKDLTTNGLLPVHLRKYTKDY